MSDFKERLKLEFNELYDKIKKLDTFINSEFIHNVDEIQRHLLYVQLSSMRTYLQCLDSRLQLLK